MTIKSTNITRTEHRITREDRWRANGHCGGVLWFTGLSGSGKTTLALELERALFQRRYQVYVLDGDNIRHGLNRDLGFSPEDRAENIRRIGEVAALFAEAGTIVLTAFISPYRQDRDGARAAAKGAFHEVFLAADLGVCEGRDPKGLYKKARRGEIPDFTGISAPYEPPLHPELVIDSGRQTLDESLRVLLDYVDEAFAV
jgi:bifunctional enzyme CysN/CysC